MSTLDKLKKVALTGHSVTLAPQSIIEIADLLGEVKASYAAADLRAEVAERNAERWQENAGNASDGWSKAITERDNARAALDQFERGFVECIRHKDRLAEELTNLLADVDAINTLLGNHAWAEHCTTTQQGQTLEGFITALVGEVTELREKVKQPMAVAEFRPVSLPEPYDDGDGNHWLCRAAVIRAIRAAGGGVEE